MSQRWTDSTNWQRRTRNGKVTDLLPASFCELGPVSPENSDNDANDLAQEEGEDEYSENDYEQVMK